jgi:hypothetical protein
MLSMYNCHVPWLISAASSPQTPTPHAAMPCNNLTAASHPEWGNLQVVWEADSG